MKPAAIVLTLCGWAGAFAADPSKSGVTRPNLTDAGADQLGRVQFEVTGNEAARNHVTRGLKLLHHMMYIEADRDFARAVEADPSCTLAHWGRAMAIIHPLWPDVPTPVEMTQGLEHVRAALARNPKSLRERAYLRPLEVYFSGAAGHDLPSRLKAADVAWSEVAAAYPDDLDAAAFSALFHLAPARFLPKDKSHRIQLEAGAIIQRVLARIPDHPGAQHYKIHAYDFPLLADRAVEICDQYGAIAPDVPHALHMPTHIYTRRGQWDKSIEFNLRAGAAARKMDERDQSISSHLPHALDYLVYAYLQRGQYRQADAIRQQVSDFQGPYHPSNRMATGFALAAIPARLALERHLWLDAARLPLRQPASFPWDDAYLNCDSIVRFARALGAARAGESRLAQVEIEELDKLGQRIVAKQPNSYWASQAHVQLLTAQAWLKLHSGAADEAIAFMRRATETEMTTDKEAVTPGEVLPAGELLGDMLLQTGRPVEAIQAYEAVLNVSPNRLNSVDGAARAAEKANDRVAAKRWYEQVVQLTATSDADGEIHRRSRAFLGMR